MRAWYLLFWFIFRRIVRPVTGGATSLQIVLSNTVQLSPSSPTTSFLSNPSGLFFFSQALSCYFVFQTLSCLPWIELPHILSQEFGPVPGSPVFPEPNAAFCDSRRIFASSCSTSGRSGLPEWETAISERQYSRSMSCNERKCNINRLRLLHSGKFSPGI